MAGGFFIIFDTLSRLIFGLGNPAVQVVSTLEELAKEIEGSAQANAPWADRTGMARAGLTASVDRTGTEVTISLFHTVDYGEWLETIQSGRFAVIMPTLEEYSDRVMAAVNAERISG